MAPLPPVAPSPSRQTEGAQQHGRSQSSLIAEQYAAVLRNEASSSGGSTGVPHAQSTESVLPNHQRNTRYASSTPSPLSSTTSANLVDNIVGTAKKTTASNSLGVPPASSRRSQRLQKAPKPPKLSQTRAPKRPISWHANQISNADPARPRELRRSSSGLTVWDLGSDYSRYFTPSAPRTPLPQYPNPSQVYSPQASSAPANPFLTPQSSTTDLDTTVADPEKQEYLLDDRLGAPYDEKGAPGWPLITDKEEYDDDMHLPQPDDDVRFKTHIRDHFRRGNIGATIGLLLMAIGLLFIFIVIPVLTSVGILSYNFASETPLDEMPFRNPEREEWAIVNDLEYPLLGKMRSGLIDSDTPDHARIMKGEYGDEYHLVFSDEFNQNNRTFYDGDDPYWFAPDIWYGATQDLEWYDPDAVTTYDGTLELRLDAFRNHGLNYRSGMLNSWNKMCFQGGVLEVSISLPGPAAVMGLWPGAWTMGNLGRPGYLSTTEGMWPYTYQACDAGITPNQSSYDGLSYLPGQKLPSCTCPGEDHPTPGTGRGAPEIDLVEAGASYGGLPIATQSYQVAPFDIWWRPDYNFTAFPDYGISYPNGYCGGPFQQAVSATTNLNPNWYDGKQYQRYSFEYVPGEGEDAYIVWKVGGETTWMMDGRAIGRNGNIAARQISEEPMSIVLNLGFSNSWTAIQHDLLKFPTIMRIDYVRWYQKKSEEMVTCDPPGFETTQYIEDHIKAYTNPNFTKWEQTGYEWPKHKLNWDC